MRAAPTFGIVALLLAAGAGAGCLDRDLVQWTRDEADVRVALLALPPDANDIERFDHLTLTVWSVAVGIAATDAESGREFVQPREFYFDPPYRIDLVENATRGAELPLVTTTVGTRAVQIIVVRVTVNDSRLETGRDIEGCFQGIPHDPPCVRVARSGVYSVTEPSFAPPAGRDAVYTLPFGVHFDQGSGEYFVRVDPARLRME